MPNSNSIPRLTRLPGTGMLAERGDLAELQRYLDMQPEALWGRDVYQSNLLHTASRHGQTALVMELLARGHPTNLLDYVSHSLRTSSTALSSEWILEWGLVNGC